MGNRELGGSGRSGHEQEIVLGENHVDIARTPNGETLGEIVLDRGIAGGGSEVSGGKYAESRKSILDRHLSVDAEKVVAQPIDLPRNLKTAWVAFRELHKEVATLPEKGVSQSDVNAADARQLLARVQESFKIAESAVYLATWRDKELYAKVEKDLAETKEEVARLQLLVRQGQPVPRATLARVGFAVLRIAICALIGGGIGPIIAIGFHGQLVAETLKGAAGGTLGGLANEAARYLPSERKGHR